MGRIHLIDTSIFLNFLAVPNCSNSKAQVLADFKAYVDAGDTFLLPMATVLETGNHIAQNGDGNTRRLVAARFVKTVQATFSNEAPWRPIEFPSTQTISQWLAQFPDEAGRNKVPGKQEGTSFGDLSIIKDFEQTCRKSPMSEVLIWSLDRDLLAYHHKPS